MMTDLVPTAGRREWTALAVLVLPVLLISMDVTVLYFALPHLSAELAPSSTQTLWILDIYGFVLAGLMLTMGALGDRIGRRRLLLLGAVAFGLASVAAAYATSAEQLIAARALLGVGGATLMPSTLALIRNLFHDPRQRRTAIAVWTVSFTLGSAVGPLVGGGLLEHFWWGSVFLIAVPVMALLLVLGPVLLPEFRDPAAGKLDLPSAALSLAAVLPVIEGVKRLAADDGAGWLAGLSIVAGLAVGAVFVRRQRRLPDPMIDVRLFRARTFSTSLVTVTLAVFALVGFTYFATQYLQLVLGLRPFTAGLWTLPATAASAVGAMLAAVLVRWIRPGVVVGIGLLLSAVGFVVLTQVGGAGLALVVGGLAVLTGGIGMAMALCTDMVVAAAPPERAGSASALSEAGSEFGGALGIAILGSIAAAVYRGEVTASAPAGLSPEVVTAAGENLATAVAVAGQLPEPIGAALATAAGGAFTAGMQVVAVVGAVVMAALAVLAMLLLRRVGADSPEVRDTAASSRRPASTPR